MSVATSMTGQAPVRAQEASGPVLFARYAFGPNRLGLCGPDEASALLELASSRGDERALRELAMGFEGAWPYLELVAAGAGISDPLDSRVVEGYWLGTAAGRVVTPRLLGRSLEERFRPRLAPAAWRWLETKPAAGSLPVHAFHVLDIFPRLGLLRGGDGSDALRVMDSCRIRWGTVVGMEAEHISVSSPPLELRDGRLVIGAPRVERVRRSQHGLGFVDDLALGETVSLHWDWLCDRLDARTARALISSTARQVAIANATL